MRWATDAATRGMRWATDAATWGMWWATDAATWTPDANRCRIANTWREPMSHSKPLAFKEYFVIQSN